MHGERTTLACDRAHRQSRLARLLKDTPGGLDRGAASYGEQRRGEADESAPHDAGEAALAELGVGWRAHSRRTAQRPGRCISSRAQRRAELPRRLSPPAFVS